MKKSFRPSRTSRPSSRPSSPRSTGGSRSKESISHSTGMREQGGSSKEFLGGTPGGTMNQPYGSRQGKRPWGRRSTPLIVMLVLFVCCVILLCVVGIYMVSQGLLTLPSFS